MAPCSCGLWRSHNKQKPLHLPYQNVYDNQTWRVGDLLREAPTHKVT